MEIVNMRELVKTMMSVSCVLFVLAIALTGGCVHPEVMTSSSAAASGSALFEVRVHLFELDQKLVSAYNEKLVSSRDIRAVNDMRADLLSRADVKLLDKAVITVENNKLITYKQIREVVYPEEVDAVGNVPEDAKRITRNVGSTISVTPAYDEQSDCVSLQFDAEYVDEPEWVNGLPLFKVSSVCTKIVLCLDDSVCMLPSGGIYRDETGTERTKVYFVEVRRLNSAPQSPDSDGGVGGVG